jgi:lipoprotein-anchoring transpeptidase ErfK/SrfK
MQDMVRRRMKWGRALAALFALVVGSLLLAACDSRAESGTGSGVRAGASGPAEAEPAVTIVPADGTAKVSLGKAVTVVVAEGRISAVDVTSVSGAALAGRLASDGLSWTSTGRLAPATAYRVKVTALKPDGAPVTASSAFRTLVPKGTVTASIQPGDGWTVGVGMPVVVTLSRPVAAANRAALERGLSVTTASDIVGAWHWMTSQQVQWRPQKYWPAQTKVHVSADLSGVAIQPGVWGSSKRRTSDFSIGSAMISTVDVTGHTMTVRRDGEVIRTVPVTTGRADLATRNGIKVIMSRETTHRMDSSTVGIGRNDPGYYNLVVKYAMRLTYSGEFLHAAPWSTGSQGQANVSHGCTGMSTADARWMFNHSKVGDVVVYQNSDRELEWGNGYTAWNEPFSEWSND